MDFLQRGGTLLKQKVWKLLLQMVQRNHEK